RNQQSREDRGLHDGFPVRRLNTGTRQITYLQRFDEIGFVYVMPAFFQLFLSSIQGKLYASDVVKLTPCGRPRALARRTPWSRRCIRDSPAWACHRYILHEI